MVKTANKKNRSQQDGQIWVRIAGFPGMKPGNHRVDVVMVWDYTNLKWQIIEPRGRNIEFSFQTLGERTAMVVLPEPPKPVSSRLQPEAQKATLGDYVAGWGQAIFFVALGAYTHFLLI
jgi:hypothetical protein